MIVGGKITGYGDLLLLLQLHWNISSIDLLGRRNEAINGINFIALLLQREDGMDGIDVAS